LEFIKKKWRKEWSKVSNLTLKNNSISVKLCPNLIEARKTFDYVTKFLGKRSDITLSFNKAIQNKATERDLAKLFTNFWAFRLKFKVYRFSRNLGCNGG